MPLQLPDLDDRRYDDLVAEALALIPTYAPEWTNHNPSDPGIMLIELFAYLTDMLMYRINRVTDENRRKFLKLLTGPEGSGTAQESQDIREAIRDAVLGIRERYRAVTKDDYEFLAKDGYYEQKLKEMIEKALKDGPGETNAKISGLTLKKMIEKARKDGRPLPLLVPPVARAHCFPQRDLENNATESRQPDHVSVVIVPRERDNRTPLPSAELIGGLKSYLDKRRLITTKVHVVGPAYAYVSAHLVIGRKSDAASESVKTGVETALKALLDPLPSANGDGWPFGRDVFVSDIYAALEKVEGVDFITDVMLESRRKPFEEGEDEAQTVENDRKIWHEEGDLLGLRIKDRALPVFDRAEIVIAPNTAFVMVKLSLEVTPNSQLTPDQLAELKRDIKLQVRKLFHPNLDGPTFQSSASHQLNFSGGTAGSIESSFNDIPKVKSVKVVGADCVPSSIKEKDKSSSNERIVVPEKHVVDWRVAALTILPASQASGGQA